MKVFATMMAVVSMCLWRQRDNVTYPLDGGRFFGPQIRTPTSTITTIRITDPTDIPMTAGVERTVGKEDMIYLILDLNT